MNFIMDMEWSECWSMMIDLLCLNGIQPIVIYVSEI